MADEIGRAKITVEADVEGVSASISDAKETVESLGDSAETTGSRVKKSFGGVSSVVDRVSVGASRIQETFSKLVIPVLFVTGVAALADKIFKMRKDSEAMKEAFSESGKALRTELLAELRAENLTGLQTTIAQIADASREAQDAARKLFEQNQTAVKIIGRDIKALLQEASGLDLGFVSATEEFESLVEAIEAIRKNETRLIQQVISQNAALVQEATRNFNDAADSFAQQTTQLQIDALREAGDFLGAAALELELQSTTIAEQRTKLLKDIEEATKQLGNEFDEVGKKLLANFDALSSAQQEALKRQQENLIQPLIDALETTFGTQFTTRLDTIISDLKELTSVSGRR